MNSLTNSLTNYVNTDLGYGTRMPNGQILGSRLAPKSDDNVNVPVTEVASQICSNTDTNNTTVTTTCDDEVLTDLPTPLRPNGQWRIQNQKMLLTYKYHIPKDWLKMKITEAINDNPRKFYCAHENGLNDPITPYAHTHVVIDVGKNFQSTNARCFDVFTCEGEAVHPHISFITKNARGSAAMNWKRACKYVCKEDKTVILEQDDMLESQSKFDIQNIWGHATIGDALSNMSNLRDAMATIQVYNNKPTVIGEGWGREIECPIKSVEDMYPWQKQMYDLIMQKPDDRRVWWIANTEGCKGKTQFIKYMMLKDPKKVLWCNGSGKSSDILHVLLRQMETWRGDTIIMNLARSVSSASELTQVYTVIENIKDGMIFDTKYEGGMMLMPNLHVIVMSNVYPNLNSLTADRWMIYDINDKNEIIPATKPTHLGYGNYAPSNCV